MNADDITQNDILAFRRGWDPDEDDQHIRNGLAALLDASRQEISTAGIRAAFDALIPIALPIAEGQVRKRLKQLQRAFADLDVERADAARLAAQQTEETH